jgi:hypothetical protein
MPGNYVILITGHRKVQSFHLGGRPKVLYDSERGACMNKADAIVVEQLMDTNGLMRTRIMHGPSITHRV